MQAAVISELGATPTVQEWPEPAADAGQTVVETGAAALNPVDLAIAGGVFFEGVPSVPYVPGREGIGRVVSSPVFAAGTRVYTLKTVTGSLAERFVVDPDETWELPPGDDDATAAALGIAGLAGWLAVEERAHLQAGERVLVLGATGTVGSVAVQAAKLLGASRVVAAGRDSRRLARSRELGADETVDLSEAADMEQAFRDAFPEGGPDVIIDPLWGPPALAAMAAAPPNARVVNLGQSAGAEISLPSAVVRGKRLHLIGHSVFGSPVDELAAAHRTLLEHVRAGRLHVDLEEYSLDRTPEAWEKQRSGPAHKLVIR